MRVNETALGADFGLDNDKVTSEERADHCGDDARARKGGGFFDRPDEYAGAVDAEGRVADGAGHLTTERREGIGGCRRVKNDRDSGVFTTVVPVITDRAPAFTFHFSNVVTYHECAHSLGRRVPGRP